MISKIKQNPAKRGIDLANEYDNLTENPLKHHAQYRSKQDISRSEIISLEGIDE
jgi:hypothetical protein